MKPRLPNLILLLAILTGGFLAWQSGRERSRLESERERLSRIAGNLTIRDSTKVHALALDTGEPLHFAWRVYLPPNYTRDVRYRSGIGSSGSSSGGPSPNSDEFIARVRLRADDQGLVNIYTRFGNMSSRSGIGDRALSDLVRKHGDQLLVEQLGASGMSVLDPKDSAVLLRLSLPEPLTAEAQKVLSPQGKSSVPLLYEVEIGPKASGQ